MSSSSSGICAAGGEAYYIQCLGKLALVLLLALLSGRQSV